MNLFGFQLLAMFLWSKCYTHWSAEDVIANCLHQGEDAEARCDGDDQGAGSLQWLSLLWLDFTQECLQEGVTSLNLVSWKRERYQKDFLNLFR